MEGKTPDEAIHKFLMVMKSEESANKILQLLRDGIVHIVGEEALKNLKLHIYVRDRQEYLKFIVGSGENFLIINLVRGENPRIKWGQREQRMEKFPPEYADVLRTTIMNMKI